VDLRPDGRLCVYGSDLLAGSTTPLAQAITHAVRSAGISMADAITMVTENPGRFAARRGYLTIGARADLVRFRWNNSLIVEDVWTDGRCAFSRTTATGGT